MMRRTTLNALSVTTRHFIQDHAQTSFAMMGLLTILKMTQLTTRPECRSIDVKSVEERDLKGGVHHVVRTYQG